MKCNDARLRDAKAADLDACTVIRSKTRDYPVTADQLREMGITTEDWTRQMHENRLIGSVYECNGEIVGFAYADTGSGEILVIALLPEFEDMGIGKALLTDLMEKLRKLGHERLWLAASPDPSIRAYGFYRRLGWTPTGKVDDIGDEILEYSLEQ